MGQAGAGCTRPCLFERIRSVTSSSGMIKTRAKKQVAADCCLGPPSLSLSLPSFYHHEPDTMKAATTTRASSPSRSLRMLSWRGLYTESALGYVHARKHFINDCCELFTAHVP